MVRWCGTPLGGFRSLANNIVSRGKTPGFQQFLLVLHSFSKGTFQAFKARRHLLYVQIKALCFISCLFSSAAFGYHGSQLCHIEETVTSGWATGRRSFQDLIHTGHPAEAGGRTTTLAATIDDGDRSGATRCLSLYPEAFCV